ncbi:hypothetical protein CFN78_04375 [Amycolatopsis antarctica]|uniref:Uncharacterized protein n=1 Tax=Amycolatopsis antarctica TaxID=1854586 RepID=A0A263D7L4_9PSEU|nr:hypothetical protein [Amycolatopsis antarctica]OZM74371.1 hypothetical protein CFN78_04375 [Amycolatopsis antarctica]
MDTNAYMTFLLVGVLLVAIDGQIIYRSGRRYLENAEGSADSGASMVRLITVLFHLVVLGLLALLSTIDLGGGSSAVAVVGKLGVVLLILAVAHAVALAVLARIRDEQVVGQHIADRRGPAAGTGQSGAAVTPVPGQQGRDPRLSPPLERGTYPATDR